MVLVTSTCPTAISVYNALPQVDAVIVERPEPRWYFLKRRARKLGWVRIAEQVLFQILVVPVLKRVSQGRVSEIQRNYDLKSTPIPEQVQIRVDSINQEPARAALRALSPDLVVVHGTRIISRETLECLNCPWVNIHAGITPRYRGSHGAYWALYHNDQAHCGVTLHLVDSGIDTGTILGQASLPLTKRDNYITYPWLQLGEGLRLLKNLWNDWPVAQAAEGRSGLFYQPGLFEYLLGRLRGVR